MSPPRRRNAPSRSNARRRGAPQRDFWGTERDASDDVEPIRSTEDPTAMIRSLGPPPLPGAETIAEHYFAAVYDRAAALAVALAAASGLFDPGEPEDA